MQRYIKSFVRVCFVRLESINLMLTLYCIASDSLGQESSCLFSYTNSYAYKYILLPTLGNVNLTFHGSPYYLMYPINQFGHRWYLAYWPTVRRKQTPSSLRIKFRLNLIHFSRPEKNCDSRIDFSDGSIRTCRNKKNKISTIFVGTDSRAQMRNHLLWRKQLKRFLPS